MVEYEPITGRYFTMQIAGEACRVYVEEAGSGIPLVCLHTAGSDARQFRHLLCDSAVTDHYRVLAFDMPWHGKSNPPVGYQNREYQLTTTLYRETINAFCQALALDRPVVMGCSMGGRIVLHLALEQPDDFRAVIALEGADRLEPYYDTPAKSRRKARTNSATRPCGITSRAAPASSRATCISTGPTAISTTARTASTPPAARST
jgi:pimeloyl-ACP methyl ester carboxylesterase